MVFRDLSRRQYRSCPQIRIHVNVLLRRRVRNNRRVIKRETRLSQMLILLITEWKVRWSHLVDHRTDPIILRWQRQGTLLSRQSVMLPMTPHDYVMVLSFYLRPILSKLQTQRFLLIHRRFTVVLLRLFRVKNASTLLVTELWFLLQHEFMAFPAHLFVVSQPM